MRDLLSVEILCYAANHGHLPTAKALQIFGCGHLGLNTSSGIIAVPCVLYNGAHSRAWDWTETLFPEIFLTTPQPLKTETFTLIQPTLAITDHRSVLNTSFGHPVAGFPIQFSFIPL